MGILSLCFRALSSCFHLAEAQISHYSSLPEIGANFHIRASRGGRSWCRPAGGVLPSPRPVLWVWREVQHLNHISPAVGNHSNTSSCASQLNPVNCTYIKSFLFFLTAFFSRRGEISLCRVYLFVLKKSKQCSSCVLYEMCCILQHACLKLWLFSVTLGIIDKNNVNF